MYTAIDLINNIHFVKTRLIKGLSHDPLAASRIQNGVLPEAAMPGNARPIRPETGEDRRRLDTDSATAVRGRSDG